MAVVFEFLRFEDRFRISVDGTPNRRNKAVFFGHLLD